MPPVEEEIIDAYQALLPPTEGQSIMPQDPVTYNLTISQTGYLFGWPRNLLGLFPVLQTE